MKNIRSSLIAKISAYLILSASSLLTIVSGVGIIIAGESGYYILPESELDFRHAYDFFELLSKFIYDYRYLLIALCLSGALLGIISFIFILCTAGHKKGSEEIQPGVFTAIPLDLLCGITGCILLSIIVNGASFWDWTLFLYCSIAIPIIVTLFTLFMADFTIRVKRGKWWQNSLCYFIWRFVLKAFHGIGRFLGVLFSSLPLLAKAIAFIVVFFLLEVLFLVFFAQYGGAAEGLAIIWLGERLLFTPAILYLILVLRKLQKSGRELANGNLSHPTDTSMMFLDFKEHGENLNSIALGMGRAVEERLKSERLKTELITNVSHDIKTPLTSIINYSDLIIKETDNLKNDCPRLTEYAQALHRQSQRLKKLLEDLMDASKVSTGNVEVLLAPCETDVLLTQAIGEYEEKLKQQELELIVKQPAQPLKIMVDSRHIWRIFDNLMNNVYKYAQPGTRVYLSLEQKEKEAVFSLKNTSRYALDISSEELTERFVRTDRSRHTEGSGLGLSIAQSLTALQGGTFSLIIDGDLFKVILHFPLSTSQNDASFQGSAAKARKALLK